MQSPAPVEYAVAVDSYLDRAPLRAESRRVYRISLVNWAWPLVGKPVPRGPRRRGAAPPVAPLVLLDDPGTAARLAAEYAARTTQADPRTANRELSALRGAVGWWQERGWIEADPTAGLRHRNPGALAAPLSQQQAGALFLLPASLREHALWRLLYACGAPAAAVLALDAERLDLSRHRVRPGPGGQDRWAGIAWDAGASEVLRWLLAGRSSGPVFVTGRRAPAGAAAADVCQVTGQARMSYRRAAELFTALTRPLDPAGRGWTLHQLSASTRPGAGGGGCPGPP
jgi:integrase